MKNRKAGSGALFTIPDPLWTGVLFTIALFTEAVFIMFLMAVDVLPLRYMSLVLAIVAALDLAALILINNVGGSMNKKLSGCLISMLVMIIMTAGSYFMFNTYDTLAKITDSYHGHSRVTTEPFNVLISGIDSRDDISDNYARSDVNMIVTVNPNTNTILLTSMPRDSYVRLHTAGEMDKLTHTGVYGIEETKATIEDWLNIDIDYYTRVDFKMLVNLVDAVGGIRVYNDIDFYSSVKGWHYKKGWHNMHGTYALWFVRERKSFEDEDEQRIKNQQKVMKALLEKVTSSRTLIMHYGEILNIVEANMQTSFTDDEITDLARMEISSMPEWDIKRQWVDGVDAYRGTWSMGPERELFVSIPKKKSVEKVRKGILDVMYPDEE